MLTELKGKVALVTGAGSGIGRGLVESLGRRGMRVVATDINEETLASTAEFLAGEGIPHLALPLDVRDRAAWEAVLDHAEKQLGPVQLVCNIAGVTVAPTPALELNDDAWSWVIDINLRGAWNGSTAVARRLRQQGLPGHIVNTASSQGLYSSPGFAAYNASKYAVLGLSETLRIELEAHNIGVSVVCPGATKGNIMNNSRTIAPNLVGEVTNVKSIPITHRQMPLEVAEKIANAVVKNQLFVISHPEIRPLVDARNKVLDAAMGMQMNADAAKNWSEVEGESLACYQRALRDYDA